MSFSVSVLTALKSFGQVRLPLSFIQEETQDSPASLVKTHNVITQEQCVCLCVCVSIHPRQRLVGLNTFISRSY